MKLKYQLQGKCQTEFKTKITDWGGGVEISLKRVTDELSRSGDLKPGRGWKNGAFQVFELRAEVNRSLESCWR